MTYQRKVFRILSKLKQFSFKGAQIRYALCAPARIRTWNNCFEGSRDIHFTTRAFVLTVRQIYISYGENQSILIFCYQKVVEINKIV